MSDLVLVIAGGEWQAPLIEKLQSKGYQVLNINYYSETKGAVIADIFEKADVIDKAECLRIAKQYNPIAVLTDQSDIAVSTVAFVAEQLGVSGIGVECSRFFTNKIAMRDKAKSIGICSPEYGVANSLEEAEALAEKIGYPVIVKPTDSQSSRGVVLVDHANEMVSAVKAAFSFSKAGSPILVEQFIEGREWTVEGFKEHDKHVSLAVSYKEHFESNPTVASSLIYEPLEYKGKHQQLVEQNDRLIEDFKLPFGITHAEYKYSDGRYFLIEVAARGGGTKISSHVVPLVSGVDVNDLLIRSAMGEKVRNLKCVPTGKHALLSFLNFKPGKVKSLTDVKLIESLPHVIDFKYSFDVGDIVQVMEDDRSRHAHVVLSADSASELHENLRELKSIVKVDYE